MTTQQVFSIYGSPGTGKTTEMLRRVRELRDRGVDPDRIGFLSHTRAAAGEALDRLGLKSSRNVSTIHSLCFHLLGLTRDMVVDRSRMKTFADEHGVLMRGGSADDSEQVEVGDEYMSIHQRAVATGTRADQMFDLMGSTGTWEQCRWFIDSYTAWKRKRGLLDFNDMLGHFCNDPRSSGVHALLIDEAQDLSPLQWQVIHELMRFDVAEVHVAGDDDQAIFVWGGADPLGMVGFEQTYAASRYVLPQSYRIPRCVHRLAHAIITKSAPDRVPKVYAPRDEEGKLVEHGSLYSLSFDARSTLILARTGARKREIERHLVNERVPFLSEGGFPGPLQNRTAKALRVLHKLRTSDSVSSNELELLRREATPRAAGLIKNRDFAALRSIRDPAAVNIPWALTDYYQSVNVDDEHPPVKLMTIHASKGREADRVVLDTALTRRVSNAMADDPASEARVFYVGVTRARQQLDVVHSSNGYNL